MVKKGWNTYYSWFTICSMKGCTIGFLGFNTILHQWLHIFFFIFCFAIFLGFFGFIIPAQENAFIETFSHTSRHCTDVNHKVTILKPWN